MSTALPILLYGHRLNHWHRSHGHAAQTLCGINIASRGGPHWDSPGNRGSYKCPTCEEQA